MDAGLPRGMFDYYDERALEYEEAYTLGTGTSSMRDPEVFKAEARTLAEIVGRFGQGRLIDLACGTGYWLPSYAANCSHITLFDQSARMLDESRKKIARLGIAARCSVIHGDVFEHPFGARAYDCALVGFLLSHVTRPQERTFFDILRAMLEPSGRFLILDSAWSPERAMVNQKEERQERRLNDGTLFEIYKRYYDRQDVEEWAGQYGVTLQIEHFATAFLAVSGYFT